MPRANCGLGSDNRSHARPARRASSATREFGEAPRTTVDARKLWAARKMASHLSVAAATAR